jgi:phosphatidylserine/phosphatidylglycerophosphate/cardiolipin synthase-like enzyme
MPKPKNKRWLLTAACLLAMHAYAGTTADAVLSTAANARVEAVFTPGDDVAGKIVAAIRHARRQVLVQAFSFTHDDIARALLEAHRRGVEVKLIADREQTEQMEHGQVPVLARGGLQVWLDGEHQNAHNKVMVIDAGTPGALIITGSFNFTRAAQYKNAENAVFISGNESLVMEYARNWQRHLAHSSPLILH